MSTKKQLTANKSSQQKYFFAAQALPCKAGRTRAAIILPYFVRTLPVLQQKLAMPHSPPLFCPLSPEAVLLMGKEGARK